MRYYKSSGRITYLKPKFSGADGEASDGEEGAEDPCYSFLAKSKYFMTNVFHYSKKLCV